MEERQVGNTQCSTIRASTLMLEIAERQKTVKELSAILDEHETTES